MIRTTFKTLCLLVLNILLLMACCILGVLVSSSDQDLFVDGLATKTTHLLLLYTAGLCIFTFVIVQNLVDVFLHRTPSPRGVELKLKIQWILLFIAAILYGGVEFRIVAEDWRRLLSFDPLMSLVVFVFVLQVSGCRNFRLQSSLQYTRCIQTCLVQSTLGTLRTMSRESGTASLRLFSS